jgi:hypothetical protein
MVKVELPFVDVRRDRRGRDTYYYFRRNGRLWRLPGEPSSPEFTTEYQRLKTLTDAEPSSEAPTDRRDYPRGTFGALVNDFLASGQYKTKSPRTRGEYKRVCDALSAVHGHKRVSHIERRHVRQIRDAKAETPGASNTILRTMKILLNFAVDDGLTRYRPAAKMKELPVGEWRAWTDEECAKFEARWEPGTMQRRAYALALYTGQRKRDQITRTRAHRRNGGIHVVQSKTGEGITDP